MKQQHSFFFRSQLEWEQSSCLVHTINLVMIFIGKIIFSLQKQNAFQFRVKFQMSLNVFHFIKQKQK